MEWVTEESQWLTTDKEWEPSVKEIDVPLATADIFLRPPGGLAAAITPQTGRLGVNARVLDISSYRIAGTVTVCCMPAARTVRLYRRSDGALAGSTTSNPEDGSFEFADVDGEAHYVVALDDEEGETYNAIIYDRVLPVEA